MQSLHLFKIKIAEMFSSLILLPADEHCFYPNVKIFIGVADLPRSCIGVSNKLSICAIFAHHRVVHNWFEDAQNSRSWINAWCGERSKPVNHEKRKVLLRSIASVSQTNSLTARTEFDSPIHLSYTPDLSEEVDESS